MDDPYKDRLSCDLLPYNLTNQLLRIINASSRAPTAAPPPPQNVEKTPGLDAFAFDYDVQWPVSLLLSRHAIIKCAASPSHPRPEEDAPPLFTSVGRSAGVHSVGRTARRLIARAELF